MAAERVCACPPTGQATRTEGEGLGRWIGILASIGLHGAITAFALWSHGKVPPPRAPVRIEFIAASSVVEPETRGSMGGDMAGPAIPVRKKRVRSARPRANEPAPSAPLADVATGSDSDPVPEDASLAMDTLVEVAGSEAFQGEARGPRLSESMPPSVQAGPAPRYPSWARQAGVSGKVRFKLLVSATGMVARILVAESSGNQALDAEAARVIAGWRFRPAFRDGVPTESWAVVPVEFVLE